MYDVYHFTRNGRGDTAQTADTYATLRATLRGLGVPEGFDLARMVYEGPAGDRVTVWRPTPPDAPHRTGPAVYAPGSHFGIGDIIHQR